MTQENFFSKYSNFAAVATAGTGISPLLILSQAYLESGAGESLLARKYNNFFGVKAGSGWTGKKVSLLTKEQTKTGEVYQVKADFRVYDNPGQSFIEQIRFLKSNPRYAKNGLFTMPNNPEKQADTLHNAGYATDIHYGDKLKHLIASFKPMVKPVAGLFVLGIALLYLLVKQ